jgi:hypothetical protein
MSKNFTFTSNFAYQSKLLIGLVVGNDTKNEITQMKENTNTWQITHEHHNIDSKETRAMSITSSLLANFIV